MSAKSWWGEELLGRGTDAKVWAQANTEVTMERLRAEVAWLAKVLGYHGIRTGSTVAMKGTSSFTQLWAVFACWSLGAQVVLLDQRITRPELNAALATCLPQFYLTFGDSSIRLPFVDECAVLVRRLADGMPASTPHCLIQFSSGTTGHMKAIGRTPESLLAELARLHDLDGMPAAGERLLLLESVTSSFGLIGAVLRGLDVGHSLQFPTDARPAAMLTAAAGTDVIIGNPRQLGPLSQIEDPLRLPRLRVAISGGDILPAGVAEQFIERFRVPIGQAYGITETGLLAAELSGGYPSPYLGRPVRGVRTRIAGGVLEVHVAQSPYPFEDVLRNGGWLATNDLVTQDLASGVLRLRGRFVPTDGGIDIDLVRIESLLHTHHLVDAAVVVGDAERIEAYVVGSAELDHVELNAWCHRILGGTDLPTRIHVLPDLPTTVNGKLLRHREKLVAHGARVRSGRSTGPPNR